MGRNEEDEYPDLTESARIQREWKVIHVALIGHPPMAGSRVEKGRRMHVEGQVEGT